MADSLYILSELGGSIIFVFKYAFILFLSILPAIIAYQFYCGVKSMMIFYKQECLDGKITKDPTFKEVINEINIYHKAAYLVLLVCAVVLDTSAYTLFKYFI